MEDWLEREVTMFLFHYHVKSSFFVEGHTNDLPRLTQTVCMVPRKLASEEVLEWRRSAFEKGEGTTHWPQEMNRSCRARKTYKPIQLSEEQKQLL
jgi:hypothetical protein